MSAERSQIPVFLVLKANVSSTSSHLNIVLSEGPRFLIATCFIRTAHALCLFLSGFRVPWSGINEKQTFSFFFFFCFFVYERLLVLTSQQWFMSHSHRRFGGFPSPRAPRLEASLT